MKKFLLIAIAFISMQSIAQQQGNNRTNSTTSGQRMNTLTPEEMAELQTKKMTLNLDLNASQQKEVYALHLENAVQRKTMMDTYKANGTMGKPSKEDRLIMTNTRLDRQVAMKAKLKTILNADQFAKWEKYQENRNDRQTNSRNTSGRKNSRRN